MALGVIGLHIIIIINIYIFRHLLRLFVNMLGGTNYHQDSWGVYTVCRTLTDLFVVHFVQIIRAATLPQPSPSLRARHCHRQTEPRHWSVWMCGSHSTFRELCKLCEKQSPSTWSIQCNATCDRDTMRQADLDKVNGAVHTELKVVRKPATWHVLHSWRPPSLTAHKSALKVPKLLYLRRSSTIWSMVHMETVVCSRLEANQAVNLGRIRSFLSQPSRQLHAPRIWREMPRFEVSRAHCRPTAKFFKLG